MIISHTHKYLFVQLPHTGTTAIGRELCQNYDGVPILGKHSYYCEFMQIATPEEKTYFVFSCIRNPMDEIVSSYCKHKSNQNDVYTNPKKWLKNGGFINNADLERYNFIKDNDADFPAFFMRFCKSPYDNWSSLSHHKFDFIIRFENLQEDFATALRLIGIEQKRPLPAKNRTCGKRRDYLSYYTPETYERARGVFGPFMKKWGYEFPPEWGIDNSVPWWWQQRFHIYGFFRRFYWKYRRGSSFHARATNRLLRNLGVGRAG